VPPINIIANANIAFYERGDIWTSAVPTWHFAQIVYYGIKGLADPVSNLDSGFTSLRLQPAALLTMTVCSSD
jgi:hypothetical protein